MENILVGCTVCVYVCIVLDTLDTYQLPQKRTISTSFVQT